MTDLSSLRPVEGEAAPSIVDGILGFLQPQPDGPVVDQDRTKDPSFMTALCPHCEMNCQHQVTEEILFRKSKHQCISCNNDTCPCDNFDKGCGGAAKTFPLWDDALCMLCSNEQRDHEDDWIANIVQHLSPPESGESSATHFSPTTPRVVSDQYLVKVHEECEQVHEGSLHSLDAPLGVDSSETSEMEDWAIVRDALLAWTGQEKDDVLLAKHCLARKAFVERWLRVSKYDLVDTAARLLDHCRWRREYQVEGISDEDWSAFEARGELFVSGVDKQGRPSCTWRVCLHDANFATPEQHVRFFFAIVERTRAVNPDAERINFLLDCSSLSFSNYDHAMFMLCAQSVQQNYPDNVEHIFVFPVGWLLHSLLSIVSPFIEEDSRNKMSFMSEAEISSELLRHFLPDQLEQRLGGTRCPPPPTSVDFSRVRDIQAPVPPQPLHPRVQLLQSDLAARLGCDDAPPGGVATTPGGVATTPGGVATAPGPNPGPDEAPRAAAASASTVHGQQEHASAAAKGASRRRAGASEVRGAGLGQGSGAVVEHGRWKGLLRLLATVFAASWSPVQGLRSLLQRMFGADARTGSGVTAPASR